MRGKKNVKFNFQKIVKIFLLVLIILFILYKFLYYSLEKYVYHFLTQIYNEIIHHHNENNSINQKIFLYDVMENVPFYYDYFQNHKSTNLTNLSLKDFPILKKSQLRQFNENDEMIRKNSKLLYESKKYTSTHWTENTEGVKVKKQDMNIIQSFYYLYQLLCNNCAIANCTGGSSGNYFYQYMDLHDIKSGIYTFMKCWTNMGWTIKDKFYLYYFHASNNSNITQNFKFHYFESNSAKLDNHGDITDQSIIDFVKDINRFKPELIISYPNIIFRICQKIYIHKNDPKYQLHFIPKYMDLSADMLYTCQYNFIKSIFTNCDIRLSYGSIEFGQIAQQIPNTMFDYIVFDDVAHVENSNDDQLIVTNFKYHTFPIIRYHNDDYGKVYYKNGKTIIKNLIGKNNQYNINYIELDEYINHCKFNGINNIRFDKDNNIYITIIDNIYKNEIYQYMSRYKSNFKLHIIECIEDCFTFDSYDKKVMTIIDN
jgi:phenylacetate-coenzyme A ligase PaaK-like adenylate-forming protein